MVRAVIAIIVVLGVALGGWMAYSGTSVSQAIDTAASLTGLSASKGIDGLGTDATAKAAVERDIVLFTAPDKLKIGTLTIHNTFVGESEDDISEEGVDAYNSYGKLGLVQVRRMPYQPHGMNSLLDVAAGVTGTLEVTPTGNKVEGAVVEGNYILFPLGSFQVTKIVKNQIEKRDLDEFRIILATGTRPFNPAVKAFLILRGVPQNRLPSGDIKVQIGYKYDPIKSVWVPKAMDLAPMDRDFFTSKVAALLK